MRTRGTAVVLALLLAIGATAAVFLYVRSVRNQSGTGSSVGVGVLESKQDIPPGTNLDPLISSAAFTTVKVPSNLVVPDAATSITELQHHTTTSFIAAGEQITLKRLSGSQARTSVLGIPQGYEAITVNMDTEHHVAGYVAQGDHIEIFGCIKPPSSQVCDVFTAVPDVEVLHVGTATATPTSQGGSTNTQDFLTLAVLPKDAAKVVFARENGPVWFSLLPPGETGVHIPPITPQQLLR